MAVASFINLANAYDFVDGIKHSCLPPNDNEIFWDLQEANHLKFNKAQFTETIRTTAYQLNGVWSSLDLGAIRQKRIAVVLPNGAEYLFIFLAIAGLAATNALLNPKFMSDEFAYAMKDMRCDALILPKTGNPAAEEAAKQLKIPLLHFEWDFSTPGKPQPTFSVNGKQAESIEIPIDPKGDDLVLLLHTSGTTAAPKTVPITHKHCVATLYNIGQTYKWSAEKDSGLLIMPLFHVHGLFCGALSPLAFGSKVVVARGGGFHKGTFWDDVKTSGATWVTAVPTMWQILLNSQEELRPKDLPPFRFIRGCSSSLPAPVAKRLEKDFKTEVLEAYAMSEATHQMTSNPLGARQFGSVGLCQGIDLAIVDAETKRVVARGEPGEVCVRGHNVITGYLGLSGDDQKKHFWSEKDLDWSAENYSFLSNAPNFPNDEETQDFFTATQHLRDLSRPRPHKSKVEDSPIREKEFLRTGDIGTMHKDGYLYLTGRSKELINRGGEKIAPLEIDGVFLKLKEVREAAAFAAPDSMLGEVVWLAVTVDDGLKVDEELGRRWRDAATQSLAKFKIPVKIYVCPELPKGSTGKVLRRELFEYVNTRKGLPCI